LIIVVVYRMVYFVRNLQKDSFFVGQNSTIYSIIKVPMKEVLSQFQ
jgi:hypothetical protein